MHTPAHSWREDRDGTILSCFQQFLKDRDAMLEESEGDWGVQIPGLELACHGVLGVWGLQPCQ